MRKTTLAWLVSDGRDTPYKKKLLEKRWYHENYRISKYSQAQLTLRSKAHIKSTPAHDLLIIQYLEWEPNESVNALAPKSYDINQCPKRNQASRTVAMLKKSYKKYSPLQLFYL
ncbi:7891_t:CDS:2 [Rhizophagus irregularis]|nr:7891_t:CDS:2 [Rhizophagus irregularis]